MVAGLRLLVLDVEVILGMYSMANSSLLVILVTVQTHSHFDFVLVLIWRILVMQSLQLDVFGECNTISLGLSEYSQPQLAIRVA